MEELQSQSRQTSPGPSWGKLLIGLMVLLVIGVGYGVLANKYDWWPDEVTREEFGMLKGKVSYPSEAQPQQKVCAVDIREESKLYCTQSQPYRTLSDGGEFELRVPVGEYYVYTMIPDDFGGSDFVGYKAYYTETSVCLNKEDGNYKTCPTDHKKIVVKVTADSTQEVFPDDWDDRSLLVSPSLSATPDMSTWQTYRNEKFEFQYPASMELFSSDENGTVAGGQKSVSVQENRQALYGLDYPSPCPANYFSFSVFGPEKIPSEYKTFDSYIADHYSENGELGSASGGKSKIFIDGHSAYLFGQYNSESICNGPHIRMQFGSNQYYDIDGSWAKSNVGNAELFEKILATVKFTN